MGSKANEDKRGDMPHIGGSYRISSRQKPGLCLPPDRAAASAVVAFKEWLLAEARLDGE
jgi:hypothetical protein